MKKIQDIFTFSTHQNVFNNCDDRSNGELMFLTKIMPHVSVIFDVGCRQDSLFTTVDKEVHYFDPVPEFVNRLQNQVNRNHKSFFNPFGLSDKNDTLFYYPKHQTFHNRIVSCKEDDSMNKIALKVRRAEDYMNEGNIDHIGFVKIDTEGHEYDVIAGFGDNLYKVEMIQFEYGGTFMDRDMKLETIIQYLKDKGFFSFSYLSNYGLVKIEDMNDHYQYCNIVCFNQRFFEL